LERLELVKGEFGGSNMHAPLNTASELLLCDAAQCIGWL